MPSVGFVVMAWMLVHWITCFPCGKQREGEQTTIRCMVTVEPLWLACLGSPAFHSIVLVLVLTWSPRGGLGAIVGCRAWLVLVCGQARWQSTYPAYSWAHLDALAGGLGLTSKSACKLGGSIHSRPTSWSTPISMCEVAFSLSLQGSDLPSKDDLYFLLLYFDKHWRSWSC